MSDGTGQAPTSQQACPACGKRYSEEALTGAMRADECNPGWDSSHWCAQRGAWVWLNADGEVEADR